jgi:hypothetical protein
MQELATSASAYAASIQHANLHLLAVANGEIFDGTAKPVTAGSQEPSRKTGKEALSLANRNALSIMTVAGTAREFGAQMHSLVAEYAAALADVLGDTAKGKPKLTDAAPARFAPFVSYEATVAADIKKEGLHLATVLRECGDLASEAAAEFDQLTHLFMSGDPRKQKQTDMWLTELKYRRVTRANLALKQKYLTGMAGLFERHRKLEAARSEALSTALDAEAQLAAKLFDRVSSKGLMDSVRGLNTHQDFSKVVHERAKQRIAEWKASQAASSGAQNAGPAVEEHVRFTIEAAPAVISPLASPLVVRVGQLQRQVGLLKSWKQGIAVLTRDGFLHIFDTEDDLATHPDVLAAAFKATTRGYGHFRTEGPSLEGEGRPQPALPPTVIASAVANSSRIDDLVVDGALDPFARAKKAAAPPTLSFELTNTTKLAFTPTVHAHAFELQDAKGWFASNKLLLRAVDQDDMVEWIGTFNALIENIVSN